MKSHFSRVMALGILVCASTSSWAQRDGASQSPLPKPTTSALAYIGAFFNKMQLSNSFLGQLQIDSVNNRSIIIRKSRRKIQSSWKNMKEGENKGKSLETLSLIRVEDSTSFNKIVTLDDGNKNYRFDEEKSSWIEYEQNPNNSTQMYLTTHQAWDEALRLTIAGERFSVEHKIVGRQKQIIISGGEEESRLGHHEFIFDADTGNLQSWTSESMGRIKECNWSQIEFDVSLSDSLFKWKAPKGAKQVIPTKPEGGFGGGLNF